MIPLINASDSSRSNPIIPFRLFGILVLALLAACSPIPSWENINEEGEFIVYRRQSAIGEEQYTITSNEDSIIVKSLQGENERGRITGVLSELHMTLDLKPTYYVTQRMAYGETTNIFKMEIEADSVSIWEKHFDPIRVAKPADFFPLHSNIPAAIEIMLYHHFLKRGTKTNLPTLPRGEISMTFSKQDKVTIGGQEEILDRYVVEGINWGGRTIWLDQDQNLVAIVKANTQIREIIKKGYEEALPIFIAGNVEEQIKQLAAYTDNHKDIPPEHTILMGANMIDGLSELVHENMAIHIKNGKIANIEKMDQFAIPKGAKVIDVSDKILIPGLWDMHAHSNQVQWAPAYLAGGITTIRDNGNEIEFATAFRDAIDSLGMLGPDILLAGMTDGPGEKGNGVIRATTIEQAREVVDMYFNKGYKQIKIYNSIEPHILPILTEEAHKRGITVTGHVPWAVGHSIKAIEMGMDLLSHDRVILPLLFPEKTVEELKDIQLEEINEERINKAISFLLEHKTALDPTINISVVRNIAWEIPIESIEPGAGRIAYELWEGKRFRKGVSPQVAEVAAKKYKAIMQIIGAFYKAGIPIVAGTDNIIPVFSLYQEIETYHKLGGLSPLQAIQTATIIPARVMGLDATTGTLEVGKEADIAILDKNPLEDISNIRTVSAVMVNGNYYKSNLLWKAADFKSSN